MRHDLFYTHPDSFPYTPLRPQTADPSSTSSPLAPEFRRDPVTGLWVIVAPERSLRPVELEGAEPRHRVGIERTPCPFCPGQEHDTPNEVFAFREAGSKGDGPGWRLRVVPNRYPAVRPVGFADPHREGGLFDRFPGFGRHEVVIESAEHISDPVKLSDEQFRDVFLAYRERLVAIAVDADLHYAAVFKNVGAEAGASLGHCHSQIVATPLVPDAIRRELRGADDYYSLHHRCVFCDMVKEERAAGTRVVADAPNFTAVAAFAGRFAFETWILPKNHSSRFEALTVEAASEVAGLMKRVVRAIDVALAAPAYNWFLHTGPLRSSDLPYYHWHFEIIPRTSRPAGFEWGTGCFVNSVAPEAAAIQLRKAIMEDNPGPSRD